MNKQHTLILAGCLVFAGLCHALDPELYAVIDLSGGSSAVNYPVSYTNAVPVGGWTADYMTNKLVLRKIPAGTFDMGSPTNEAGRAPSGEEQRAVTFSKAFYMGVFEVTEGQYERVYGSPGVVGSRLPIANVSYNQMTLNFADMLKDKTGLLISLPTEAQWEYASRAGTATAYPYGSNDPTLLTNIAWYATNNTPVGAKSVGQKTPNAWGLYDTCGNVQEMCLEILSSRYLRGGNFTSGAYGCRSASRESFGTQLPSVGFRLYMNPDPTYLLTVNGGTGGGSYSNFVFVAVTATNTPHFTFAKWLVAPADAEALLVSNGFDANAPSNTVVMPYMDTTLTVSNTPVLYSLTVTNGLGSGTAYTNGQEVVITADPPQATNEFDRWVGDTATVGDIASASTTVAIPGTNIALTAIYRDRRYLLTVVNGSGGGLYTNGQTVAIQAGPPPTSGHTFQHWAGDTAGVADASLASTQFTMPDAPATITAIYQSIAVPQNTFLILPLGGGAESYLDEPPPGGWGDAHKTTQMVFRKIPAGSFTMGSPSAETGRDADETSHAVTLTKDFYLGIFEVTQKQWNQKMGTTPGFFSGDTLPVEQVSYTDATAFALAFGGGASLPTEAQWEYACRAGTTSAYASSLDNLAWYDANSTNTTQVVGTKAPNAWGLYDMHGNVFEICLDWYSITLGSASQVDPTGPAGLAPGSSATRVMRGGAYSWDASYARSAYRGNIAVTNFVTGSGLTIYNNYPWVGFRMAIPQTTASFSLTVLNGMVNTGGVFAAGTAIGLTPQPAPAGMKFGAWQVSPAWVDLGAAFDRMQAQTLLTMPTSPVTVTAVYIPTTATTLYRFLLASPDQTTEMWMTAGAVFGITAPTPAVGYRFDTWAVSPASADLGTGFHAASAATIVVMPPHDVTVTPSYTPVTPVTPDGAQAPTVGVLFMLDAGEGQRPATFSSSRLPSGLRLDRKTGVISGIPTRPGDSTVQVTARHADGSAVTYDFLISVQALDAQAQGTFTGYLYAEAQTAGDLPQIKGLLTLKVSSRGRLSAKVVAQTANYSFSGKAWDEATTTGVYRATLERRQGERIMLEVNTADGTLSGMLSTGPSGTLPLTVVGQRNAFLDRTDSAAQSVLAAYLGYYTVSLPMESCETDPMADNVQSGSGYLTVTVRDKGAVKIAGRLADGTRVSLATTLLTDDAGATIPLFAKLYSRRGVFAGLLQLAGGSSVPTAQHVYDAATVRLAWIYPGRSPSQTGDRFNVKLSAFGAYYDTLANLHEAYADTVFQADGFEWALPLIPGSAGSMVIATGDDNPNGVNLRTVKRTGLFSGSFKAEGENGRTVTFKHAGVLTRDGDAYVGDGAYVERRTVDGYTLKSSYRVWISGEAP